MPNYRRWYEPGGSYFFTIVMADRRPLLAEPLARQLLGTVMREVARERPFETQAIVVLPDHLHCLWALPRGDTDFSGRWRTIKAVFTRRWLEVGGSEGRISPAGERRRYRG